MPRVRSKARSRQSAPAPPGWVASVISRVVCLASQGCNQARQQLDGDMELTTLDAAELAQAFPDNIPHLSGPAAAIRQVLAAHFVRDCPHIVEIGGHLRPVTHYLTHAPLSVLSVDPKTPPLEADELNGHPCRVRHVSAKFQDVDVRLCAGQLRAGAARLFAEAVRQPRAARTAAVRAHRQCQDRGPRISAGAGARVLAGAVDPVAAVARGAAAASTSRSTMPRSPARPTPAAASSCCSPPEPKS